MSSLLESLTSFDPDLLLQPAVALRLQVSDNDSESTVHKHRKGQLILALHGSVTCKVPDGLWLVPPHCAVWIPGGLMHRNQVSANGRLCFLFVEPDVAALPDQCCTLRMTPLLLELIQRLATLPQDYATTGPTARLVAVLLDELEQMPTAQLYLPISRDKRLRRIAAALMADPSNRYTIAEWATQVAMSERTLARLLIRETGMTFGRWRQQLHLLVALQRLAGGMSVQLVSGDLGYESVSAFITMFKKATGKSPARYFADQSSRG
ncbi:AraC family transcriptional regulator [Herbaspirillum autotrophicum]|uniref:AraC family transcriptional regulator n=1 Tax=Herbaspirillum autotrophicum TaxID=180195 RepID=UPI00067C5A0F|nr:helix-turn-helix transcriptional regulator [Herbaspirillum autotrophicum]